MNEQSMTSCVPTAGVHMACLNMVCMPVAQVIHSYNARVFEGATKTSDQDAVHPDYQRMEELRFPVERPDFKSGRGCQQSLVGSTPTLFRHLYAPCA